MKFTQFKQLIISLDREDEDEDDADKNKTLPTKSNNVYSDPNAPPVDGGYHIKNRIDVEASSSQNNQMPNHGVPGQPPNHAQVRFLLSRSGADPLPQFRKKE